MAGWWKLLEDGLDAVLRLLDAVGLRGTRWEWRKRAWRGALARRKEARAGRQGDARRRARICRSCRTLMGESETSCPQCGTSARGPSAAGAAAFLSRITPSFGSVTMILVTVNIVMMLLILAVWGARPEGGMLSFLSPSMKALYAFGAKWAQDIRAGEVWRLVTAIYLHGGLLHLFFNSFALVNLGPLIEESFGSRKFFVIYTTTGITGFVASTLFSPRSLSVGASGAIFGLLGFALVYGRYRSGPAGRAIAEQLMRWLIFGAILLFIPNIDNAAHVGGAVTGAILGLVVEAGEPRTRAGEMWLRLLTALMILVTVGSFLLMAISYPLSLQRVALL
jgi:rhomboid protease GluP